MIKALLAIAGGVLLLASCNTTEPVYAKLLSTDVKEISFDAVSAQPVSVKLSADGEWYVYAPAWLKVEPETGNGDATVKITALDNVDAVYHEVNAPRKDAIAFCGALEKASVSVMQKGEAGLDATRKYVKVTKAEDLDLTKKFILASNVNGSLLAAKAFDLSHGDGTYNWMPSEKVVESDGVIEYSGTAVLWSIEGKAGEYLLRAPNGCYINQDAAGTYDNIYLWQDPSKGDKWNIGIDADGVASITNVSVQNKLFGYATDNNGFGASVKKTFIAPSIYMDQAAPSTEVLTVDEQVFALPSETSAVFNVSANCKWSVRCHDTWVKSFSPASGEGNGTVTVTFDANATGVERTASLQFIGQESNTFAVLSQGVPLKTVAELNKWMKDKKPVYELDAKDLIVTYANSGNIYLEDETAGVLLYSKDAALVPGNLINGTVKGKCTLYNGLPELTSMDVTAATLTNGVVKNVEMTLEAIKKDFDKLVSRRIIVKGIEVTDGVSGSSDRSGKVKQGEEEMAVYSTDKKAELSIGSKGDLVAFPSVNNNARRLSVFGDSFIPTYVVASASAKDITVEVGKTTKAAVTTVTTAAPTYDSANESIATVDPDGTVKGITEGETTVTVSYPAEGIYSAAETSFKVTVVASATPAASTVAGIVAQITSSDSKNPSSYEASLTEAVVSYANGNNAYIEDNTGAILLYMKNHGLKAGDVIKGKVSGTGYIYNGLPEITAVGTEFTKTSGGTIPLTEMTIADLLANFKANISRRVLIKGVSVTDAIDCVTDPSKPDRDGKISQAGSEAALRAQLKTDLKLDAGATGDIIVYPCPFKEVKQLSFWANADFVVK